MLRKVRELPPPGYAEWDAWREREEDIGRELGGDLDAMGAFIYKLQRSHRVGGG